MQSSQKGLAIVFLPDENEIDIIIPQQMLFKNSIIYVYMH